MGDEAVVRKLTAGDLRGLSFYEDPAPALAQRLSGMSASDWAAASTISTRKYRAAVMRQQSVTGFVVEWDGDALNLECDFTIGEQVVSHIPLRITNRMTQRRIERFDDLLDIIARASRFTAREVDAFPFDVATCLIEVVLYSKGRILDGMLQTCSITGLPDEDEDSAFLD